MLPFLISFLNSATVSVRVIFCLRAFDLLPLHDVNKKMCVENLADVKMGEEGEAALETTSPHFYLNSLDSEGVMTITAALIPCFEGALGDSDELVSSHWCQGNCRMGSLVAGPESTAPTLTE